MRKPHHIEIEKEIAAERAAALGLAARRLRTALQALRKFDADAGSGAARSDARRTRLVQKASEACHAYVLQRELLGFGREDAALVRREYEVPPEVWNRMGAVPSS
jgi:uncharacterized protein DUF6665